VRLKFSLFMDLIRFNYQVLIKGCQWWEGLFGSLWSGLARGLKPTALFVPR